MRTFHFSMRDCAKMVRISAAFALAAMVLLYVAGPVVALSIPVTASDGTAMGTIDVTVSPDGKGVVGGFNSSAGGPPPTLAAAAAANGEDHFNWYQRVVRDNMPPKGADGAPLAPPYDDPPLGGYDNQWGDNLPWYWDEGGDPPSGTPGWEDGYHLNDNLIDTGTDGVADKLNFEDFPWGAPGTSLEFNTWLVSLNADGSLHSYHGGFAWTWDRPPESPAGGGGDGGRNIFPTPDAGQITMILGPLAIPEPSCIVMLLCGGFSLLLAARRRR